MNIKWTNEKLAQEALKYTSKIDFKKFSGSAYQTARRKNILDEICNHMTQNTRWTFELLQLEASKYNTRSEFQNNSNSAYLTALRRKIIDKICKHMPNHVDQSKENNSRFYWTLKKLQKEANKYKTRGEFQNNSAGAYMSALRNGSLDIICAHMEKSRNISTAEMKIFNIIKEIFPNVKSFKDREVNISSKPHIKGFDIDIFVPELSRGIEFDGKYYHSVPGLKRSRRHWPHSDLKNYHKIKDKYFLSKGIQILHIKEENWLKDKEKCIEQCFTFLGNK